MKCWEIKRVSESTYLQDLPELIADYGLNKTLTTRSLTIDWKHRDTEIYLRSPELLDKVRPWFDIENICRERSNQLRYIYYVHRKVFSSQDPNDILDTFEYVKKQHFNTSLGNTFIDIGCIMDGYEQKHTIVNSVVFSYRKMQQRDVIKYLISRDLPIPNLSSCVITLLVRLRLCTCGYVITICMRCMGKLIQEYLSRLIKL